VKIISFSVFSFKVSIGYGVRWFSWAGTRGTPLFFLRGIIPFSFSSNYDIIIVFKILSPAWADIFDI